MDEITITMQREIVADKLNKFNWPQRGDLFGGGIVIESKSIGYGQNETTIKPLSKNKTVRKLQIFWYKTF